MPAPPLPAELSDLLARLEAAGAEPLVIDADEVEGWPAALADALKGQGAVERAPAATSVVCPGCEHSCVKPVVVRQAAGHDPVAFVVCNERADIGRVSLRLSSLNRWQMTVRTLARALAGPDAGVMQPIASGWRVASVVGPKGQADVLLLKEVGGALQIGVAGHWLTVAQLLVWDGRMGLDLRTLARLADAPIGGPARESPDDKAARLRRRLAELKSAGVRAFRKQVCKEEGLSVTRLQQIIDRPVPNPPPDPEPAHPFSGLGVQRGRAPVLKKIKR